MPRPMHIRRYRPADQDVLWQLNEQTLPRAYDVARLQQNFADMRDIAGHYLARGEFLVGEVDGRIVAMGAIRPTDTPDECELKRMRVAAEFQGQGLGQAMLEALERRATELGYRAIVLDTTTEQLPAQKLYQKNGFRVTGTQQLGPFTLLLYRKEL